MSKGTEFSETPKVPEIQESLEISEARQDLDRATHDPESSADKVGDFKKAENLESEFKTAMDNALDPTEPPEDTASSSGEVTDSQETAGKTADQAELDAAQNQITQEFWEAEMEVTTQEEQNAAEYIQGIMDMVREVNDQRQSMVSEGEEEPTASEVSNGTEISESEEEPTASNTATESAEEEEEEEQELAALQDEVMGQLEVYQDAFPEGDVMGALFHVFKESIDTTNSDKEYWLGKLAEMNKIAEAMADHMEDLPDEYQGLITGSGCHSTWTPDYSKVVAELAGIESELSPESLNLTDQAAAEVWRKALPISKDTDIKQLTDEVVQTQAEDLSPDEEEKIKGLIMAKTVQSVRDAINTLQKDAENMTVDKAMERWSSLLEFKMDETSNNREQLTSAFENFDQKTNQLYSILSTVLKNIKEMSSSVDRNPQ